MAEVETDDESFVETEKKPADLGTILSEASKIKSAQMNELRRVYTSWPLFVQHSLLQPPEVVEIRQSKFEVKMSQATVWKDAATHAFKQGMLEPAVSEYIKSLSVFRYVHNKNEEWRKKGLCDADLVQINDSGNSRHESELIHTFVLTCYLNLALCYLKLQEPEQAMFACNFALEVDPKNAKALFRRAQARLLPAGAGVLDLELAVKDLSQAAKLEPTDMFIRREYIRRKAELGKQRQKDKASFGDMFERGEALYTQEQRNTSGNTTKEDRSNQLPNQQADRSSAFDFMRPSKDMLKSAKEFGIDLTDSRVIEELNRLQNQRLGESTADSNLGHKTNAVNEEPLWRYSHLAVLVLGAMLLLFLVLYFTSTSMESSLDYYDDL
eukprot:GILJ01011365.1.p1 GENE.GILJ01011365.1~~GILJ01011365.1.p1  ORF type:complete len:391 (-),score=69.86 GILJ01011365.1:390-1535(-)